MQIWLLSAIVIVGLVAAGALMYSLHRSAAVYDGILTNEVAQQEAARVIQVSFKTQVQEWKNILLRGSDYEQYKKYAASFHAEEKAVRDGAAQLQARVSDEEAKATLAEFLAAQDAL
jgi:methyl-accepting chemotaxis protein-1 (serine sensor receptor)